METLGKVRRVRIYTSEDDVRDGRPLHRAVVDMLRAEHAGGATAFSAVEGFGASGDLHGGALGGVVARLPVVVEWIDTPEQVDRLLPRVLDLVGHGLVTVDEPELVLREPHRVRDLHPAATVADVMRRELDTVAPSTPIREVVERMLGHVYRALPVVEGRRLVGLVTNTDLVQRGGLGVRLELLRSLESREVAEALERLGALGRTAGEAMTRAPVTIAPTATLAEAADRMARRRLKRLPVVDAEGCLLGMVSRVDLLRAASSGAGRAHEAVPAVAADLGLSGDGPLSRVMRRDAPVVHPETPLPEVFQAVISTRLNRAFVVDAEGRVLGLVTDAELLERITPDLKPGALRSLARRLPFARPREEPVGTHARGRTAADVMSRAFVRAEEGTLLSEAIGRMLREGQKVLAVVDASGRLVGMVDRADLLRGLVLPPG